VLKKKNKNYAVNVNSFINKMNNLIEKQQHFNQHETHEHKERNDNKNMPIGYIRPDRKSEMKTSSRLMTRQKNEINCNN